MSTWNVSCLSGNINDDVKLQGTSMDAQGKVSKPGTSPKSVENMLTLAVPLDQFVYLFTLK